MCSGWFFYIFFFIFHNMARSYNTHPHDRPNIARQAWIPGLERCTSHVRHVRAPLLLSQCAHNKPKYLRNLLKPRPLPGCTLYTPVYKVGRVNFDSSFVAILCDNIWKCVLLICFSVDNVIKMLKALG